jgi:hypothetical protein
LNLTVVRQKAIRARQLADKTRNDLTKGKILAQVLSGIETGKLTEKDIKDLISGPPVEEAADSSEVVRLFIAPGWDVLRDGHSVRVEVSTPHAAGTAITSASRQISIKR